MIKDGQLPAATEEERFTHIKHSSRPIPFTVRTKERLIML